MTPPVDPVPQPPRKLLAGVGLKLRIAAGSALILGVGVWLAPRAAPTGLSTPQEHAAPLLEEQAQRREAVQPFRGVLNVASRVRAQIVAVGLTEPESVAIGSDFFESSREPRAAGFGVFVSTTHVLTHASALDGRPWGPVALADGRRVDAQMAAYEPATGLVLLRVAQPAAPLLNLAAQMPEPGTLAVAVGTFDGRDLAVPVFITSATGERYTLGAAEESVRPGMPVYSVDAELVAVAAGDGRDGHAFPIREAADRLMARANAGDRRASVGIMYQPLEGTLAKVFGEEGVLVNRIVGGGPADAAGLQAGDVIVGVADRSIDSVGSASQIFQSLPVGTPVEVRVVRDGKPRTIEVTPALTFEVAALARRGTENEPAGAEARAVLPGPLLDAAGIPPAARVLLLNGRAVSTRAQAERELRRRPPLPVLLRDGDRQYFAALEASR